MGKSNEEPVGGFVVKRKTDGRFLSRSGRWVRHSDREFPGTRRAWVHQTQSLLEGCTDLQDGNHILIPACFDPIIGYTAIAGKEMTVLEFAEELR
jgi:hypothetical protein